MKIAITGTIGSGKSSVSAVLKERGFRVFDADKLVHQMYEDDPVLREYVLKTFGPNAFDSEMRVNRSYIAQYVFSNKTALRELESVIFPQVSQRMLAIQEVTPHEIIFFEVPVLFEAKLESLFDKIWVVAANDSKRHARLMSRGMTREDILKRESQQISAEIKRSKANAVIENNASIETLKHEINRALKEVTHER